MQVDIEGSEWEVLKFASTSDILKFKQILIEFHMNPTQVSVFESCLDIMNKIRQTHTAIHVHFNNNGICDILDLGFKHFSGAIEVTYIRTSDYPLVLCKESFPTELDTPNDLNLPDVKIGNFFNSLILNEKP